MDLAFNPDEPRDRNGRWIKVPGASTIEMLLDTINAPAPVTAPAEPLPDGWKAYGEVIPGTHVFEGPHGHTVSLPIGYDEATEHKFVKRMNNVLRMGSKASPLVDKDPVDIKVWSEKEWTAWFKGMDNPMIADGAGVAGFVNSEIPGRINVNPMAVLHSAQPFGKPIPAQYKVPFSQVTAIHELGHVVHNRSHEPYDTKLFDSTKGMLSDYADTQPSEGYAEAWAQWVLSHQRKMVDGDVANTAAAAYAKKYGWGWTK
jgi:hypothetical protein